MAARIDQIRDLFGCPRRPAFDEHQMEADAKAGHRFGPRESISRGIARNHPARGGEDALAMRLLHRPLDGGHPDALAFGQ